MMPPGEQRQRVLQDWIAAEMPWTEVESRTSEEYLIERWNQRFGAKEDGQQPK